MHCYSTYANVCLNKLLFKLQIQLSLHSAWWYLCTAFTEIYVMFVIFAVMDGNARWWRKLVCLVFRRPSPTPLPHCALILIMPRVYMPKWMPSLMLREWVDLVRNIYMYGVISTKFESYVDKLCKIKSKWLPDNSIIIIISFDLIISSTPKCELKMNWMKCIIVCFGICTYIVAGCGWM